MKTIVLISLILQFLLTYSIPIDNNTQKHSSFTLKNQHDSPQIYKNIPRKKINETKFNEKKNILKNKLNQKNQVKEELFDNNLKLQLLNRIKKNVIPSATVICCDTNSNNGYNIIENCNNNQEGQQILTIQQQQQQQQIPIQIGQNSQQNLRGLLINCLLPQTLLDNLQNSKITQVPAPQQQQNNIKVWTIPNDIGNQQQFTQEFVYQQQPQQLQSTFLVNPQTNNNNYPINFDLNCQPEAQPIQNNLRNEGLQLNNQANLLSNTIDNKIFLNCLLQAMQNNVNQNNQQIPQGGGLQNFNKNGISNNQQFPQQSQQQQLQPPQYQQQFPQQLQIPQYQQQFPQQFQQNFPSQGVIKQPNNQENRGFPLNLNQFGNQSILNNGSPFNTNQLNNTQNQQLLENIKQRNFGNNQFTNFGRNFNSRF